MLVRWRLRKRGTFAITTFVFFSVASFVLFTNMVHYPGSHELPNDYDLSYNQLLKDKGQNGDVEFIKQQSVVRRTVAVPLLIPGPLKHIDRKPQSHRDSYNGIEGDLLDQEINPKFAPILKEPRKPPTPVNGKQKHIAGKEGGDVDYALPDSTNENDDKNIENVVIEEENNNDDEEEEETYEDLPENPEFQPGDFDQAPPKTKPPISVEEVHTEDNVQNGSVEPDSRPVKSSSLQNNLSIAGNKSGIYLDNNGVGEKAGNQSSIKSGGINVMGRQGVITGEGKVQIKQSVQRPDSPLNRDSAQLKKAENKTMATQPCLGRRNCANVPTANHQVQIVGQGLAGRQLGEPRTPGLLPEGSINEGVKIKDADNIRNARMSSLNDNKGINQMNQLIGKDSAASPRQPLLRQPFQVQQQIQKPIIPEQLENKEREIKIGVNLVSDRKLHEMSAVEGESAKDPFTVYNNGGFPMIVEKIYWSSEVEKYVPKGITEEESNAFVARVRKQRVQKMAAPQWNKCGRPKNQYVEMSDKTALCARYRAPHNKLITGEVLSFYLGRLLGLDNIPVVVLSEANTSQPQWLGQDFRKAGWGQGNIIAFIQWIDNLDHLGSHVKMPKILLEAYERGTTVDFSEPALRSLTVDDMVAVLQWTDMILFDFVTGHYDRVASMQDGAEREKRPTIMHESIRNLRKSWNNGKMWLIDNESGLFDAYELIYAGGKMGHRFVDFHKQILQISCLYRKKLVENLRKLSESNNPMDILISYAKEQEPLLEKMKDVTKHQLFNKHFPERLKEAYRWIKTCEMR